MVKTNSTEQTGEKPGWLKKIITMAITAIVGIMAGAALTITINPTENGTLAEIIEGMTIELADEQVPTVIETDEGEVEIIEAPTVEEIDSVQLATECEEGLECGRGWWVDTSTPQAFKDAILGLCVDTDGYYGSQCWDTANLFWQNTAGRWLSTCGTGAAKGTIGDGCWQQNAGNDFEMVWEPTQLKAGDIVVFGNGQWGHIGMAMGPYNNGYIALLGTNQGGKACNGGGSTANIINISLGSFIGAFRWKGYVEEEPVEPVLPVSNCVLWHVLRGDTMTKIMLECENTVVYGPAMDAYAKTWYSLLARPGQSVYDGWQSESGVGLYAGDDIEHRVGGEE